MTIQKPSWATYLLGTLVCVFAAQPASAQREAMNWYFGDKAGLSFATGSPIAISDGQMSTLEGCATISDPNTGELLFYTNGETVWNFDHEPMINGTELNGDPSTSQSAIILPWPGRPELYAIVNPAPITSIDNNDKCICLTYSIVDMNTEGGRGSVIEKNIILAPDVTEHVTATRDCEDTGWWIVARRRRASAFVSFHLTPDGLDPVPVESPVEGVQAVRDVGQTHISPDGTRLVITAPSGVGQLFRFRRSSGRVFGGIDLLNIPNVGSPYGAAFSPDSRRVFIASTVQQPNPGINIYQFDIDDRSDQNTVESRKILGFLEGASTFVPMQLAPDRNIYVGRPGRQYLAQIKNPTEGSIELVDSAVALTGVCFSGLPNIPGWILRSTTSADEECLLPFAVLEDQITCDDECLRLQDESIGLVSTWNWTIDGAFPAASNRRRPVVCFPEPGEYNVTLIVGNQYGFDTTQATITALPRPTVTVEQDTIICTGGSVQLIASGAESYEWSPAVYVDDPFSQSPTVSPRNSTVFSVIGTSADGCVDTALVSVQVVTLEAGADISICEGGSGVLTATQADSYLWEPAESLNDPTKRQPKASPTETTTYTVTMTLGDCVVKDSMVVTVGQSFEVVASGPDTACIGETVVVEALGGSGSYQWEGDGVSPSDSSSTTVVVSESTQVIVIAGSGDCIARDTIQIVGRPAPSMSVNEPADICPGESVMLTVSGSADDYTWSPSQSLSSPTGVSVVARPTETTTYTVVGHVNGGCSTSLEVTVVVRNGPAFVAGPDLAVCAGGSVRLQSAGSADAISWQPTIGLSDPRVIAPIASPSSTTTYIGTAERDGCTVIDTVIVRVSDINLNLGLDKNICQGDAIELEATGAATYSWIPTTGLSDPNIGNPIASPSTTTTYEVTAVDAFGCTQVGRVTVVVKDTTSIVIEAARVTADAGSDRVAIPVILDVDPDRLPLVVDRVRAAIVHRADVFLPTDVERGRWATSVRDDERITYIDLDNITIVTPRQKITEVIGTVMLGHVDRAEITWEDITWWGVQCPRTRSRPGRLYVTGCSLDARPFTTFTSATVQTIAKPSSNAVEVRIGGSEPGTYSLQMFDAQGNLAWSDSFSKALGDSNERVRIIDMTTVSSGMYHVVITSPTAPHVARVAWLR